MKALIIDDEPPVITVVKLLVNWERNGIDTVLEAGSAEDAIRIIETSRPEIILSDINLPGLSGLDLIELLKEKNPSAKVIVISAFDKFSYAQRAVELGCVEYLLKPIQRDAVNRALEKAVARYQEDIRLQEDSAVNRIPGILSIYLSSGYAPEILTQLLELAPWMREWTSILAGVISMGHFSGKSPAIYQVQDLVNRSLIRRNLGAAALWGNSRELVLLMDGRVPDLSRVCRKILQDIREKHGFILSMGLSGREDFPGGLSRAYRTSQEIALSLNLLEDTGQVQTSAAAPSPLIPHEWIEKILFAGFPDVTEARIRQLTAELEKTVSQSGSVCVRQLENFRSMYNSARSRSILGFLREQKREVLAPEPFSGSFCLPDGRFRPSYFAEVLAGDLMVLRSRYRADSSPESMPDICLSVRRYLEAHYLENISLEELAKRYGVSFSYLSRTFKKETGTGMMEFLTALRIQEACELLEKGMRTADAGAAVGFDDPKYFSRVFRKEKGMSPSEYREKHMRRDDG